MNSSHILATGIRQCFNEDGQLIDCHRTGQDAELKPGRRWNENRYERISDHLVKDRATHLIWSKNACPSDYPLSWMEGLKFVQEMNDRREYGRKDWRMPNRRELRSLIDHGAKKPALSKGHPFENVFLGWFWTSTTAAIATRYAWYVHLEGGRMFYGNKDGFYWVWPVCGSSDILASTGATACHDEMGMEIPCSGSGQDGELLMGAFWPEPRFVPGENGVKDLLTGLVWHPKASFCKQPSTWQDALLAVQSLRQETNLPWRLPSINELESLVDASAHSPALSDARLFTEIQESYWSSTTSAFDPCWSYVLYLTKGAVGVGYKKNKDFFLWPVLSESGGNQSV
jgi:hypothetical protein